MINGVYPKKGAFNIGGDADVVVVDMDKKFKIRGEDLKTIQKITPYEGIEGVGAPAVEPTPTGGFPSPAASLFQFMDRLSSRRRS